MNTQQTHPMWDSYLKLIAGGMMHDAARAKLAELYAVDGPRVETVIAARGDLRGDPDPSEMNAILREKAFRKRVIVELEPTDEKKGA